MELNIDFSLVECLSGKSHSENNKVVGEEQKHPLSHVVFAAGKMVKAKASTSERELENHLGLRSFMDSKQ